MDSGLDLCLVVPPFALVGQPTLGVGILAAACRERGIGVRAIHGNVLLAARAGYAAYTDIALSPRRHSLGDRLFAPYAYPDEVRDALDAPHGLDPDWQKMVDRVAPAIEPFLDELCARILALRPRILGISSVFQQNLASSAIARRIKAAAPEICIVMGGPNVASPMGEALAEIFPWIDHFFSGEADIAFADFCERLVREGVRPAERVIHCPPLMDMRQSPMPAFDDYFEDLRAAQAEDSLPASLPDLLTFETSRGCWWGAKHHCTFCGLNGATMAFREKPGDLVLAELDALGERWGIGRYMAADNIMPLRYFSELLPQLAARETRPEIFYEVKANLSDAQLGQLMRAGVRQIQPGIESLSSNVLRLMRKGVSAHQNVALLRGAMSWGIEVVWNYLYGFPGETVEDYTAILDLIPAIEHLQPPDGFAAIVIDRFSPYFNDPQSFGIERIAPIRSYRGLYPPGARLDDIAYHFRGKYSTPFLDDASAREAVLRAIGVWQLQWMSGVAPRLTVLEDRVEGVLILDTRRIARARETVLPHAAMAVLRHFEQGRSAEGLDAVLVEELLAARFLIAHEGKLASVVVRPPGLGEKSPSPSGEGLGVGAVQTG